MDDLLSEFLTETNEGLTTLDVELVKLEQNPNDTELLSSIFRLMHTIKGTCGFLGLPRLESVAHSGENIMGRFRDGELPVSAKGVSLILECLDRIRDILSVLEATEAEPEGDDSDLIARLNAHADGADVPFGVAASPAVVEEEELDELERAFREAPGPNDLMAPAPTPALAPSLVSAPSAPVEPTPVAPAVPVSSATPEPVALSAPASSGGDKTQSSDAPVANQTIRVSVDVLENLMTMVSELVLTRNQVLQILRTQKESEFAVPLQRLNHVVSELQEGVMKTRMQPIGNAWAKLPRIVRDLAHELDKKINLVMKGAETELDRQVLDLIKDPLTHMVRNSADHGLELPAERALAGKSETGQVVLDAYHEGGHIIIKIKDDGRGLSTDRIKAKCVENGLATEADLETMNDHQIHQFVFKAGFSTAAQVTAVSGRGVGMDVVRTNIEKIGGTVELSSVSGKGTTFTIKIPLTLAIVSALIVESGTERFAIPQLAVVELVRASDNSEHVIERINDTPVLRLRNRLLPLVNLGRLLNLSSADNQDNLSNDNIIVVAQVGAYSFGIIVDRVFDTEEIVVKPVSPILRHIQLFSGNTILGDGAVVMILDPNGIAAATGEVTVADEDVDSLSDRHLTEDGDRVAMLVFKGGGDQAPKSVPLALVSRLEEIEMEKVEYSGGQHLVQYRGQLMPLVPMEENVALPRDGRRPVLVFSEPGRSMGLIVDEIIDIVEDRMNVEIGAGRSGFIGSAIIAEKATDVLDTTYYLTKAFPDWFVADSGTGGGSGRRRILVVDDSSFFRNLLTPLLTAGGYDVTAVESATVALQLCEEGRDYDVIVSDIEMPEMSGFEFAETLRRDSRWRDTPIVALSSFQSASDLERGRAVGFNDYVAKTDRDALLVALHTLLDQSSQSAVA